MSDASPSQTFLSPGAELAAGTMVLDDRFRVVRLLGSGGMGFVYLAEQVSLGRPVALKVLRGDLALAADFTERFRREALLLSSVEHPAVVRVIDYGKHGNAPCLVMEYVEGETLEQALSREAPLAVTRVERLMSQLTQGLAAIHAKGIVHRDLKPDNVVLTKTADGQEQARLLDFGIARLMEPGEASVTQLGMVLGTPEYVSPEQGLGQQLDARSDLYSLGVMMFRALTGKHPFAGPGPREYISQHIHQRAPSVLDAAPHLKSFPGLVAAVDGALQKDPASRPQSATGMFVLSTTEVLPLSAQLKAPGGKRDARKPLLIAGGVGALVIAVLVLLWLNEPARKSRRLISNARGAEALQVLEELGPQAQTWPLQQLRAAALHQVGRHEDEWKVMSTPVETEAVEPIALESLADDYGRAETARLRKLMAALPKASALPELQRLAKRGESWHQWGALRFVDAEYMGQGLPLVELYEEALEHKDCGVRRIAAKRLVDFRTADVMPSLEKLKALPREKGDGDCGQAAAEAALKQLAKE